MGELAIALFCGVSILGSGIIALRAINKLEKESMLYNSVDEVSYTKEILQENIAVK